MARPLRRELATSSGLREESPYRKQSDEMKSVIDKGVIKKRRRHSIIAFEMIRLDRAAAEPLHQQLYRQIRDELIQVNVTHNSSRLPSSRELAADLGVSRLTVNLALSKLHSEGYLQSRVGSGTFAAQPLPETFL